MYIIFFFTATSTTEIYTLSLHDALPISNLSIKCEPHSKIPSFSARRNEDELRCTQNARSEEHTSELQSPVHLVCRLLLEKKKKLERYDPGQEANLSLIHSLHATDYNRIN